MASDVRRQRLMLMSRQRHILRRKILKQFVPRAQTKSHTYVQDTTGHPCVLFTKTLNSDTTLANMWDCFECVEIHVVYIERKYQHKCPCQPQKIFSIQLSTNEVVSATVPKPHDTYINSPSRCGPQTHVSWLLSFSIIFAWPKVAMKAISCV